MKIDQELIDQIAKEDPQYAAQIAKDYRRAMITLARKDPSMFCAYVLRNERTGGAIHQHPDHERVHRTILANPRTAIWTHPEFGKCEIAGTPVLKEDGSWAPIESLSGWTRLVTWNGLSPGLKTVTARSTPNGLSETVRIGLDDGRELRVTPNHPLMTADSTWKAAETLTTDDHLVCLRTFELPEPFLTPESDIPDDEAEILGYLLAGRALRTDSVQLRTLGSNQKWSKRREKLLGSAGWKKIPVARVDGTTVTFGQLRGVMPPATFLRLWATVDADGWPVDVHPAVYKLRRRAIERLLSAFFSAAFMDLPNKRRRGLSGTMGLGDDRAPHMVGHVRKETLLCIQRLMLRVGAKARISRLRDLTWVSLVAFKQINGKKHAAEKPWKLTLDHGEFRRFWPSQMAPPVDSLVGTARIVSVERLPEPVETWAVEVLEEEHSYLSQGVLSHNTNQISIGHVLWRIGTDPNCSIAIMTNTGGLASRIIGSLKTYIAESMEFRDVFPNVRPGDKWSESAFTVTRETIRKDPTVQAVGLTGSIVGSRLDGLIIDDIDDIDSTHTQEARNGTEAKVRKQALTRLGIDGWAIAIGNVWHEDDCMHRLAKTNWKVLEFPVMRPDPDEPGGFLSRDEETFPMNRIHLIRDEDVGPVEFQRLYLLQARIDGEQRFRPEWIDEALAKGKGLVLCSEGLPSIPRGCRAITGVDLGVKQKASSDPTAIVTILEMPQDGQRVEYQILNIVKGRWNAEEIMNNVTAQQRLFGSEVWVESNGAQDFLIQLLNMNGSGIPVRAFWTGKNKFDPAFGVESIASEMALGRWWIPSFEGTRDSTEMEVEQLVQEMLAYTPGNHTGDILMALWIARESARTSRATSKGAVEFGRLRLRR